MAESKHKAGDIVRIYQRPFSHKDFEGEAKLIEIIKSHPGCPTIEEWWVQFSGEEEGAVSRVIVTKTDSKKERVEDIGETLTKAIKEMPEGYKLHCHAIRAGIHAILDVQAIPNDQEFNFVMFGNDAATVKSSGSQASININDQVSVVLTDEGLIAFRKHYRDIAAGLGNPEGSYDKPMFYEDYSRQEKNLTIQLWPLMEIFGKHLTMGARDMFEGNNIKLLASNKKLRIQN